MALVLITAICVLLCTTVLPTTCAVAMAPVANLPYSVHSLDQPVLLTSLTDVLTASVLFQPLPVLLLTTVLLLFQSYVQMAVVWLMQIPAPLIRLNGPLWLMGVL